MINPAQFTTFCRPPAIFCGYLCSGGTSNFVKRTFVRVLEVDLKTRLCIDIETRGVIWKTLNIKGKSNTTFNRIYKPLAVRVNNLEVLTYGDFLFSNSRGLPEV